MEKEVILNRFKTTSKQTLGTLQFEYDPGKFFNCFTLELPWLNNINRKSCIPLGEYECEKVGPTEAIPYDHILIKDVKGRSGICIHIANYYTQILGCIVVGDSHTDMNHDGEADVTNSRTTFRKFMNLLPNEFKLIIT